MSKYLGWTNYTTWKVNLEYFDGGYWSGFDAQALKDYVLEDIENKVKDYVMAGWLEMFIEEVNFKEIAEAHNEEEVA